MTLFFKQGIKTANFRIGRTDSKQIQNYVYILAKRSSALYSCSGVSYWQSVGSSTSLDTCVGHVCCGYLIYSTWYRGSMHGFSTFFNLVQRSLVFGFIVRGWKILKYHVLTPWYQVLYIKYPVPCQYMYLSIQFVVKSERAGAWVKSLGQGYLSTWYGYLYLRLVYKAQNLCETEWMSVLASYK